MSTSRVLLKGIYLSAFSLEKKQSIIDTIETVIEHKNDFWEEIEKIAITVQNNLELACWNCGLLFTTKAWGIPVFTYSDTIVKDQTEYKLHHNLLGSINKTEFMNIKTIGFFCTIHCAVRYLEETIEIPANHKAGYKNLLYFAYSQHCGRRVSYIPPAYPKTKMKLYCAEGWSEQEYREKNAHLSHEII